MDPIIALLIVIAVLIIVALSNIFVVQQSKAYVIERLGAFQAVQGVGLHFKVPFIDRIARRVSLKEQVLDYPPQPVITKDNVTMQIDTVVYFQITDPKLYTYGVEQPMAAMETLTATTLRNIIGDLELDQTLTSRDIINTKMRAILDEATDPWGIKVNRVEQTFLARSSSIAIAKSTSSMLFSSSTFHLSTAILLPAERGDLFGGCVLSPAVLLNYFLEVYASVFFEHPHDESSS